jgi:hypothetical protein
MTGKRVVCAVAAAVLAAPLARAGAETVLWVNGTESVVPPALSGTASGGGGALLGGLFGSDPVSTVRYPASFWPLTALADPTGPTLGTSVGIGIRSLDAAITSTPGQWVVVGTSQGSLVVDNEQRILDGRPNRPLASSVSFVATADPQGPTGIFTVLLPVGTYIPVLNYTVQAAPTDSPYDTTEVNYQYDGVGNFPDRPWNLVADANALLGGFYLHPSTPGVDLSTVPSSNITSTTNEAGGKVTSYLVPAPYLPLTKPLADLGVPAPVVNQLNSVLKPIIDAGYSAATPNDGPRLLHGQLVAEAPPTPQAQPTPASLRPASTSGRHRVRSGDGPTSPSRSTLGSVPNLHAHPKRISRALREFRRALRNGE